jgi:hypothetical protein
MLSSLSCQLFRRAHLHRYKLGILRHSSSIPGHPVRTQSDSIEDGEKKRLVEEITSKLCPAHSHPHAERPIAIEVDGPSHFYVNTHKYTAYTKLKHRLLTRMGYKVLHVPYFEWRKLRGAKERENYMKTKLMEDPTEWLEPEDEHLFAERLRAAEDQQNKPSPPKTPRPSRKATS